MSETEPTERDLLKRLARDQKNMLVLMTKFVNSVMDAESEIPEKLRRFGNWFHDLHDVKFIYEEHGQVVPDFLLRELERCDDRLRHLLEDALADDGAVEKIRREMSQRQGNRWDHTRQLVKPQEPPDETRK